MALLLRIVNGDRFEIFKGMINITSLVLTRQHVDDILSLEQSGSVTAAGLLVTTQSFAGEIRKLLCIVGCLRHIKQFAPVLR